MSRISRVRGHLRSNAIAYLALFVAIGIAPAWAATLGKNDVRSKHIKNGQVKTPDIKRNAVRERHVRADELTGASIDESSLQGLTERKAVGDPAVPAGESLELMFDGDPLSLGRLFVICNPGAGAADDDDHVIVNFQGQGLELTLKRQFATTPTAEEPSELTETTLMQTSFPASDDSTFSVPPIPPDHAAEHLVVHVQKAGGSRVVTYEATAIATPGSSTCAVYLTATG